MLNHITVAGRLTRDPEMRHTANGTAVASFSLAVDRDYTSKDGGERETDFVDIVAWRGTAEFVGKYFRKGQEVAVDGRLIAEKWEKEGEKKSRVVLDVRNVHFCGKREDSQGAAAEPAESQPVQVDDDLPFDFSAERR